MAQVARGNALPIILRNSVRHEGEEARAAIDTYFDL
jgi:hypothetical protein